MASRRLAPALAILAALLPALAPAAVSAQTNLDQGKSAAQIFGSYCAACHKSTRGLANGRNSLTLTGFLSEHYTTSRQQASALAAYVLGAGGGAPPERNREQKPGVEHARGPAEGPKGPGRQSRRSTREEEQHGAAKPQPEAEQGKPPEAAGGAGEQGAASTVTPPAGRHGLSGRRGSKSRQAAVHPPETAVPAAPSNPERPGGQPGQSAAMTSTAVPPQQPSSTEAEPVERDNIPD